MITARHGRTVAHVPDVATAVSMIRELKAHHGTVAEDPNGAQLATIAKDIMAAHSVAVALLGAPTIARGLAARRKCLGSKLTRDVRALDSAAAMLRHDGSANSTVDRPRAALESPDASVRSHSPEAPEVVVPDPDANDDSTTDTSNGLEKVAVASDSEVSASCHSQSSN